MCDDGFVPPAAAAAAVAAKDSSSEASPSSVAAAAALELARETPAFAGEAPESAAWGMNTLHTFAPTDFAEFQKQQEEAKEMAQLEESVRSRRKRVSCICSLICLCILELKAKLTFSCF